MSSKIGPLSVLGILLLLPVDLSAQDPKGRLAESAPTVTLELAPGALGAARSGKGLLIASGSKGREIHLFDKSTGELKVYLESGDLWRKAVTLRDSHGQPLRSPCFRMDADAGLISFSCSDSVALFKPDGSLVAQSRSFFLTSDVTTLPTGEWGVGLLQVPEGNGKFMGTKEEGSSVPRLVALNRKLEVAGRGLAVGDEERSPNQAAARSLMLAASNQRVFAAELANYKIYELNRQLKLRSTYTNPKLQLEDGRPQTAIQLRQAEQKDKRLRESVAKSLEGRGSNATKAPAGKPAVEGGSLNYAPVIQDIAWDPVSSRLAILLNRGASESGAGAIDFLDPLTGEAERVLLRLPEGLSHSAEISQISIGRRFIWLRAHKGDTPTLRLDRFALEQISSPMKVRLAIDGGSVEEAPKAAADLTARP